MKIAMGLFYHEANSFNPMLLMKEDMVYFEGEEVIRRLYASEIFQGAGVELVPLVYALALPNGIMSRACYDFYADRILKLLGENRDVDGVFLHLHGSAEVEGLVPENTTLSNESVSCWPGKVIGVPRLPCQHRSSHAPADLVVRNYRTVPHTDQDITERQSPALARHAPGRLSHCTAVCAPARCDPP